MAWVLIFLLWAVFLALIPWKPELRQRLKCKHFIEVYIAGSKKHADNHEFFSFSINWSQSASPEVFLSWGIGRGWCYRGVIYEIALGLPIHVIYCDFWIFMGLDLNLLVASKTFRWSSTIPISWGPYLLYFPPLEYWWDLWLAPNERIWRHDEMPLTSVCYII